MIASFSKQLGMNDDAWVIIYNDIGAIGRYFIIIIILSTFLTTYYDSITSIYGIVLYFNRLSAESFISSTTTFVLFLFCVLRVVCAARYIL